MLKNSIRHVEATYECKVKIVVTDNAKNMEQMRKAIEETDIVTFGCLAHWLNLLGVDITAQQVIKHVVEINKYFRNHHMPGVWLSSRLGLSNHNFQGILAGKVNWPVLTPSPRIDPTLCKLSRTMEKKWTRAL